MGCAPQAAMISSRPVPRSPASRKEKYCPASPAIESSFRSRPRMSADGCSRRVTAASSGLGVTSPLGWLCRTMSPVRPRGEDGWDKDVRHGDLRARARAARAEVPGGHLLARREAREREHFHPLLRAERCQRAGRGLRVVEDQRRQRDDMASGITQRPIRTHELPHAMAGGRHTRERRRRDVPPNPNSVSV